MLKIILMILLGVLFIVSVVKLDVALFKFLLVLSLIGIVALFMFL